MEKYLRSKGIHHAKSATYWPTSIAEVDPTIKHCWNWYVQFMPKINIGDRIFYSMLVDYRLTKHATTRVAPATILFNRHIQSCFKLLNKTKAYHIKRKQKETTPARK